MEIRTSGTLRLLSSVLDVIFKAMFAIAIAGLVTVVGAVSWQVFSRYVTASSASWAQEVAQIAFVWTALFAIAIGVRQGRHLVMDAFTSVKNRGVNIALDTVATLAVVIVSALLAWYGNDSLQVSFRRVFPALGIATGWMHLAVPVSFGACVVFGIESWVRKVFGHQERAGQMEQISAASGVDVEANPENEEVS